MEDREMLMKEFRKLISPTARLDIRSGRTNETIKVCYASELSEYDMHLNIDSVYASTYFDDEYGIYLGVFVLSVYED
jgi:hypothetical protein